MRIAVLTDGIWPYVLGGMQKHSFYLCKYFAKNKVQVDLFHFNQSNLDIGKLDVFTTEEKKYITSYVLEFPASSKLPGHYIRDSYKYSKKIFEVIKPMLNRYDFIYSKGFSGWYLIEQKRNGNIKCAPVGVKFHGYEMFQRAPDLRTKLQQIVFLRKPVKFISQNADVVFSYGGNITSIIKGIGVAPEKIFEIPSGVEDDVVVEKIKPTNKPIRLLYLGRYERRKGIEELNKCIELLNTPECEFHFAGPIPKEKQVQKSFVTYHGEIREKEKLNLLIRTCDVLLCPSWSEGLPNVILEAMANGLSVAATSAGATAILVDEKTGWIIPGPDHALIKRTIENIISAGSEAIDKKKEASLSRIRAQFTWGKIIQTLTKKIAEITA